MAPLSHPGMEGLWTGDQGCFCFGSERFWDVPDLDGAVLAAGHYKAFLQPERNESIECRETILWFLLPDWDLHTQPLLGCGKEVSWLSKLFHFRALPSLRAPKARLDRGSCGLALAEI